MATKDKAKKADCRCCGVHFDPTICSQCQVAGCAGNGKADKCRLTAMFRGTTMQLSEFQLQQRVQDLEKQLAAATIQNRELVDALHAKAAA